MCPTKKPKRQSFEWYNPKHILKKNWILKYLHVLPSLIVVFVDLEWKDPQWSERQLQCSTMMQQLKTKFQDRFTKIALVLLQKTSTFLATDDLVATERAAALANICEINAKQLFVLPVNDQHLLGYTIRLESAFLELAQSFYIQMLKSYRSHQTTSSHQTLKVRHQFKMGYICELRLDFSTALKYYTQAYANLEDIRVVDTNCLEIKTVAGFINYKMCKLMFKLNLPRDSITQFKAHIEKYKQRTGFKELLFEHYGWTAVQFQCFADLFADAVKNGLAALQTQHPGIYYLKAAEFLYKRRETHNQICASATTPTEEVSSFGNQFSALYSDYFGVRNLANKNIESGSDQQIIALVQELENKFNYSVSSWLVVQFTKLTKIHVPGSNNQSSRPSNVAIQSVPMRTRAEKMCCHDGRRVFQERRTHKGFDPLLADAVRLQTREMVHNFHRDFAENRAVCNFGCLRKRFRSSEHRSAFAVN